MYAKAYLPITNKKINESDSEEKRKNKNKCNKIINIDAYLFKGNKENIN